MKYQPCFLLLLLILLVAPSGHATTMPAGDFAGWLQQMESEAIAKGISSSTVHAALDNAVLDERVIDLDQKQPEKTVTFDSYVQRIVSPERIRIGQSRRDENFNLLQTISQHYGVPAQIILALWGIESSFGHNSGSYHIIDSLTTLAYMGRRPEFFRGELINALRILDQEHIPAIALRGSWAGAMGQCQFMPSTYLKYAVDYDGDGRRNIWDNQADIFASIASYLSAEGWRPDINWGREVVVTTALPDGVVGLTYQQDVAQWSQMGLRSLSGDLLPNPLQTASLIQPDGPEGRSFLVTDNYRALMRWNRSTYFATSVGLLADALQ
jgi:membrane-bound lytic murein transglycosylase B